jgi:poly(3-hydroxybutyrate) depolymerase
MSAISRRHRLFVAGSLMAALVGCGGGDGKPGDAGSTGAAGASGGGVAGAGAAGAGASGTGSDAAAGHAADAAVDVTPDAHVAADATADTAATVDAGPSSSRLTARLKASTGAPNSYLEYLPPGYDGTTFAPLLVFWHGIGEDGDGSAADLPKVEAWGPPKLIANDKWDATRPFIVLSPQYTAQNGGAIGPGAGCPSSATIDAFFTWALGRYKVDAKRVYLTGLSCGAIGSWDYLANFQGTVVAAAVLLSGNPGEPTQAGSAWKRAGCTLGTAAIWSFHGDADPTVPYAPDHDTMQDLLACPVPPRAAATFTPIIGGGHIIWDPIYDLSGGNGDIYAWMLANAKP